MRAQVPPRRESVLGQERMARRVPHGETHATARTGWLRAAVLGSDDAIVSTASLMIGVASASQSKTAVFLAGVAGLVAGSMSMAVGEYVSVSSQRDAEKADVEREKEELANAPEAELKELATIYVKRGLDRQLAMKVATALTEHDRLAAHMRDELGIVEEAIARPVQAAWISAVSFASFATVPLIALLVAPSPMRIAAMALLSLASLGGLGALGGYLGGAPLGRAALRVTLGGGFAMAVTAAVGRLFGTFGG
jgi:VIT1/CCC1 family predicted Fe2+/Mn2+ transporter